MGYRSRELLRAVTERLVSVVNSAPDPSAEMKKAEMLLGKISGAGQPRFADWRWAQTLVDRSPRCIGPALDGAMGADYSPHLCRRVEDLLKPFSTAQRS